MCHHNIVLWNEPSLVFMDTWTVQKWLAYIISKGTMCVIIMIYHQGASLSEYALLPPHDKSFTSIANLAFSSLCTFMQINSHPSLAWYL